MRVCNIMHLHPILQNELTIAKSFKLYQNYKLHGLFSRVLDDCVDN